MEIDPITVGGLWACSEWKTAKLINLSENHTFLIECMDGSRLVLRVHRRGYQDKPAIQAELEWIAELRRDTLLDVPEPLPGIDGDFVQVIVPEEGESARFCVLFAYKDGIEPDERSPILPALFERLGAVAARCHVHASGRTGIAGDARPVWTVENMLSPGGLWGDWRIAPHVTPGRTAVLEQAGAQLQSAFAAYGRSAQNFGLIHADMRLANLLVDGDRLRLIDFDDCGFGWFVYDFAAAVSFFEESPDIAALKQRWLKGYSTVRRMSAKDLEMIDAAILLRRMLLLAWIGSHNETSLAKVHQDRFSAGTERLALAYLQGRPLS